MTDTNDSEQESGTEEQDTTRSSEGVMGSSGSGDVESITPDESDNEPDQNARSQSEIKPGDVVGVDESPEDPPQDGSLGDSRDTTRTVKTQKDDSETTGAEKKSESETGFGDIVLTEQTQERKRKKWFIFAVGGCGNNLLDAIHMRKMYTTEENDPREVIWHGAIEGVVNTNTNNKEIRRSYYATEIADVPAGRYASTYGFPGEGAGQNEKKGETLAENGFEEGIIDSWSVKPGYADAIMLLHSAVKGTGSGATPCIASRLKDFREEQDTHKELPIYSCVVLPERIEGSGGDYLFDSDEEVVLSKNRSIKNAAASLGRMAEQVEVIIPFQNGWLDRTQGGNTPKTLPQAELGDFSPINFREYYTENKTLVSYLETLSMTAVPKEESEDRLEIEGAGSFDVIDPYEPSIDMNPNGYDEDDRPALVFAPAHACTRQTEFDRDRIRGLLEKLSTNRLANFDPETAWGCSLLFYGPEEAIRSLSRHSGDVVWAATKEFGALDSGFRKFNPMDYYLTIPELDQLHVWAGFWNPKVQVIEDCHAFINNHENNSRVKDYAEQFERLYNNLGREAFR